MIDNIRIIRILTFVFNLIKWKLLGVKIEGVPRIYNKVRIIGARRIQLRNGVTLHPYNVLKSCNGVIYVGKNTSIGEFTYINSMESVRIGDNVLIAPSCHITDANHNAKKGSSIILQGRTSRPVEIGNDVWVGAGAKILSGVRIGDGAIVAAGAVVTSDVPSNTVVAGVPARKIRERSL